MLRRNTNDAITHSESIGLGAESITCASDPVVLLRLT